MYIVSNPTNTPSIIINTNTLLFPEDNSWVCVNSLIFK